MLQPWAWVALRGLVALALAWRARRLWSALPRLPAGAPAGPLPALSIVVPARDEAATLPRLLPSLAALRYPGAVEVLVVDDQSTDGTAAVARAGGARVIAVEAVPDGWTGKPHANHLGAAAAGGAWLLFTDADTVHAPDGPARAVALAQARGLDGLSLLPRQLTGGALEGAVLMTAFAGLFAGWRRDRALLDGQFVLLSRAAYEASGGWAAVRGALQDDVALGAHLAAGGWRVPLWHAPDAVAVRMYADAGQLWRGVRRLGAGVLGWAGPGALATLALVTAAAGGGLSALAAAADGQWLRAAASWLAVTPAFLLWAPDFGGARRALLGPFGALFVVTASTVGILGRALGRGTEWRGRRIA